MSAAEGLVDLSLFSWAPSDDFYSHSPSIPLRQDHAQEPALRGVREYYAPPRPEITAYQADSVGREEIMKPLPPLPRNRVCQQVASYYDDGSQCILKRIRRTTSGDSNASTSALLQRRQMAVAPPQLTLSAPVTEQGPSNQGSSMVWMPDEQMWLVISEVEPSFGNTPRTDYPASSTYPTPPAYTPRGFASSEPSPRAPLQWDLTPPQTPLQSQLQSLLHPRDEERLSPLFQEAMNSVPLNDPYEYPPPPSYEGTVGRSFSSRRSRTPVGESSISSLSPSESVHQMQRARSTGSSGSNRRPRLRLDTTDARSVSRSIASSSSHSRSQTSLNLRGRQDVIDQDANVSNRSWHGLAQKMARPRSAT